MELNKFSIHYEENGLMKAFEQRKVPAKDFITKNFIPGNNFFRQVPGFKSKVQ